MVETTRHIVATVAFLLGADIEKCRLNYSTESELFDKLFISKDAIIIRCLCRLNTQLLRNYSNTSQRLYSELTNINKMSWFDSDAIKTLQENGVDVLLTNSRAENYRTHFLKLIDDNIDKCNDLFPNWLKWQYIRNLFVPPKYSKTECQKSEYKKYKLNRNLYPFQCYFFWQSPTDVGNMLQNDKKFLKLLYSENNDCFAEDNKCQSASPLTKSEIYDFINQSHTTILAVDCENSDCYKICEMLKSLKSSEMIKISKIVLYDDIHTTSAWQLLHTQTSIPVEVVNVERVLDRKSIVDIKMTAGICQYYYENTADSFIICSSDSDYWGLISSLPQANFLVMYEHSKCSSAIKDAFSQHNIAHFCLDDFGSGNISEFQKTVLISLLNTSLPKFNVNVKELTDRIYDEARIRATDADKQTFIKKYIKTLQIQINNQGELCLLSINN